MPLTPAPDYFAQAPFAAPGPELFRTHTCIGCGTRAATWAAFVVHRRECAARPDTPALIPQRGAPLPGGEAAGAAAPGEQDPFLDAPAAALRLLEAWQRDLDQAEPPKRGPAAA